MTDLDLLHTEVEEDLRASVRDLLAARCDHDAVTRMYDGDRSVAQPLWRSLAVDLGLAGLLVPEGLGGAGATAREAAVVLEELGRAVAPVPFLTSAVVATAALGAHGPSADSPAGRLLGELAAGERTAALVVPFSAGPGDDVARLAGLAAGGSVRSVAGALEADVLLVPVASGNGTALRAVPADAADVTPVVSLDMSRRLADVSVPDGAGEEVVADGDAAVRNALEVGAALLASEQYGVAAWCLTETVSYLKQRRQFGRVVGGFQALKHRLADLFTDTEQGLAAARYAAAALVDGTDTAVATSVAQAFCGDLAVRAAEEALQLHGGIGMTWEHPVHLYLKRAKADQIALGTPGAHRARLARLADLPGPEGDPR